jgi:hypothetical protein
MKTRDPQLDLSTAVLLSLLADVKWVHTSGRVADAVRWWQASGCPDLSPCKVGEPVPRYPSK